MDAYPRESGCGVLQFNVFLMPTSTPTLKTAELYRAGEYWVLDNGECKRFLESARIARDKAHERGLFVIRAKHRDRRVPPE